MAQPNENLRPFQAGGSDAKILSNQDLGRPYAIGFDHENCRDLDFTYGGSMSSDVVHEAMPDQIDLPAAATETNY